MNKQTTGITNERMEKYRKNTLLYFINMGKTQYKFISNTPIQCVVYKPMVTYFLFKIRYGSPFGLQQMMQWSCIQISKSQKLCITVKELD